MRALRPMTQEERDFAEQHHNLVIDFLRCAAVHSQSPGRSELQSYGVPGHEGRRSPGG